MASMVFVFMVFPLKNSKALGLFAPFLITFFFAYRSFGATGLVEESFFTYSTTVYVGLMLSIFILALPFFGSMLKDGQIDKHSLLGLFFLLSSFVIAIGFMFKAGLATQFTLMPDRYCMCGEPTVARYCNWFCFIILFSGARSRN
jgi:hypothetical protein